MALVKSRFGGGGAGIGPEGTWFHDCRVSGATGTLIGEACGDCGAVERISKARLRARLRCIDGGRDAA